MKKNIILTGFMGAGKTTTARELARYCSLFALDTDALLTAFIGGSIRDFFAAKGEAAFRELEQKLAVWLENSVDNAVISTGGGFFMAPNLLQLGHVFFLDMDFDAIYARLQKRPGQLANRPLFKNVDKARTLFVRRLPLYRQHAHYIIQTRGRNGRELAMELFDILQEKKLIPRCF